MAQTIKKKKGIPYLQAVQQLKKDILAPVYFIFGEEKYLHDLLIDKLIDLVVEPATKDFNFDLFYASDVEAEKIVDIARSYPMVAKKRIIVVKDVNSYKQASLKILAEYVTNLSPSTCLVMSAVQKTVSGKSIDAIISNAIAVDCRQLYENEVSPWIKNYVQSKNIDIDFQAIQLLQTQVGNSLLNIVNELEKAVINIHPRKKITYEDIQKVTSFSKQNSVFELCDAVGNKNFPVSIAILNNLLDRGEKPTTIVIQLTRHLSNLMKISESVHLKKSSAQDLAALTRLNIFFINKIRSQANNFKAEQLRRAFDYLTKADMHLKTSYQRPKLVMELLLYNLTRSQ